MVAFCLGVVISFSSLIAGELTFAERIVNNVRKAYVSRFLVGKLKTGMTAREVRSVMGNPDSFGAYQFGTPYFDLYYYRFGIGIRFLGVDELCSGGPRDYPTGGRLDGIYNLHLYQKNDLQILIRWFHGGNGGTSMVWVHSQCSRVHSQSIIR